MVLVVECVLSVFPECSHDTSFVDGLIKSRSEILALSFETFVLSNELVVDSVERFVFFVVVFDHAHTDGVHDDRRMLTLSLGRRHVDHCC